MTIYENEDIYRLFFNEFVNYEDMEALFETFRTKLNAVIIDNRWAIFKNLEDRNKWFRI